MEGSDYGLILWNYPGIWLQGPRKTMENLNQEIQCLGAPTKDKSEALPLNQLAWFNFFVSLTSSSLYAAEAC
jgi:hypothetical protein